MGPSPRTPNMQAFCSEHRGIHTSLYSSLPQEAVQFLEKAIWFKMVGRTDDARAIFGDELKRFEETPVVAIEHAELELEAGKWGRAWRILNSRLIDPKKSHEDLESPEHRLILLTWAMLGTRHRGDLDSSAREIERTQVWLGNVPVSDYSDIQASCIRRYVIAYLFTTLYNGYKNPDAEHLPAHDRLDSSGSKIPWGGLRQLRRSLTGRGMFNEANALFRVEVNRTPPEHRGLIFEEFLREVASLSSYRGKELVEAAVRLQWASTHVQLQATSSAVEEFSKSELAFSRFCDRFDITDKSLTPHMQALEYERLSCIEGPVDRLEATEELADRFEAIDGLKTGLCLSTAAELALAFYKATSLEDFRVKYFSLQTRLETYDAHVSEDICDLVHHHVELSSATLGGLVDRQNALEWIDGFFAQYRHFSAPVVLALLYRSKESLLKGLRRIEEARLAGQKATEMEAFEPSLGEWLHTGRTYPALPVRSTTDSADPHSQDEEKDESQPFFWSWRDVIGDEKQIQERAIQLVLTWLADEIAAENPALEHFKGITAPELKELVFTEPKVVDASKEERYSQICTWLGEPPIGERNRRLFCLLMLRDARQMHLENKKLWELRLAELGHLLELEKSLPRVIRENFQSSKGSWLAAMALTHLACLESVSDFTDEKSTARLAEAETYNEFALVEFRQQNDQARVAIHQRSGAQICMLKITRLNQEIKKLRANGIDKAKKADAIFSQGELHASRSAGLDGITNRQNLTAFYGSGYTVHTAISLLLAEPGKLTAETIKSAWQWVQKYKARSLARTIGVRIFDPPELIKKIMASPETASLYQEMLAMQKKIEKATPSAKFDLRRQLDARLQFMKANHDLLRQLIDLREATPFELSDIASIEAQCGTQVVLVDWFYLPGYVVGETGRLLLFTANGRSETTMDLLTTTLEDVTAWQKVYLNPPEDVDSQEENLDKDEAREAFDKMLGGLVAPLAHHTKAGKLVVLCPSAQLHRLPLHALSIKETYFEDGKFRTTSTALIHRNPCVYTHSHSLLRSSFAATEHTRSSPGPMKPQFISGIPGSKTLRFEAGRKSIRELALRFHTDPMIDQSALKKDFLAVAHHSRLLHLHTHCNWKSEDPLDHEIELPRLAPLDGSTDERQLVDSVTAREFFDVHLSPGTHVNLIACQGGVTDVRLGDEVMGLGPALLCSGASSIVSTLWSIDDNHGVRFEKDFFDSFLLQCAKKRKKNGTVRLVNLAKAMQAAAKEMDEGESAPLYRWAGYVLHGCWQFTMSEVDAISQSEVPGALSVLESVVSFPQSGPASIEDLEVVWNAVPFTTQQNEKEQRSLKRPKSKQGGLKEVVQPSKLWVTFSLKRLLLTFHNRWARWRRQPVAEGRSRVEWTCACGHDLFADFHNKSPDMLNKYAAILQRSPNGNSHTTTSQPSTNYLASPPNAHLQPNSSSTSMQLPQDPNNFSSISASQFLSVASNKGRDPSFLELCINTGPHLKSLAEIDTRNISTDGALFQAIRTQYLSLRGFRSRFWLLKPAAISFVRVSNNLSSKINSYNKPFSLEKRHRVGILQKPLALPPKSEVDAKNWIYEPCPLDGDPPIAEDLFLHYLQCSEGSTSLFWMRRFPQRLEASLLKGAAFATFGWGIHIDEGPDFAAIFKANFLVLILSGVAAGLWTFFERDFQGAFGFACWIVAVLNSLLMAYVFKWKQE